MKSTLNILLLILLAYGIEAQKSGDQLFDATYLHEVKITFSDSNWYDLMTNNFDIFNQDSEYLMADIEIDGEQIDSIGARWKGFTSYVPDNKKPIKIDINQYVPGKKYDGLRKFNLNNGFADPSMQRDFIGYHLHRRNGVIASRTAYTKLYINDQYYGLYLLVEQVDKAFLDNNFKNSGGNLYKNTGWDDHQYLGEDPLSYSPPYELRTNESSNDYSSIKNFASVLNSTSNDNFKEEIEKIFDVDSYLRILATDVLLNNWDSDLSHGRNWFLYQDFDSGKLHWIPWDYNLSLGGDFFFDEMQANSFINNNYIIDQRDNIRLLIKRLLNVPTYYKKYNDLICSMTNYTFTESYLFDIMDGNRSVIDQAITQDENFLYSPNIYNRDMNLSTGLRGYIQNKINLTNAELSNNNICNQTSIISVGDVVINEFVASNDSTSTIRDEFGEYDDWIELYNNTNQDIDLTGAFLSDNPDNPNKWEFPIGSVINANDYLIIWADEDQEQGPLHTNFKLSKDGESIHLYDSNSNILDLVEYGEQITNVAAARIPNGTGDFVMQESTFGFNNEPVSVSYIQTEIYVKVYPIPANNFLNIDILDNGIHTYQVKLFNDKGQSLYHSTISGRSTQFDITTYASGIYYLHIIDDSQSITIKKIVIIK